MRASEVVFRHRFWWIALLFNTGFSAYFLDGQNAAVAAVRGLGLDPEGDSFGLWLRGTFAAGALCVLLAAALRTWATAYLTTAVVHDAALHDERLVADGPYRHVRNPLYLGLLLLVLGIAPVASRLGSAILVVGATALVRALIAHEEERLAASQGEAFEAYRRAVPRLLPSLRPRVPPAGRRPQPAQAFLGESFFWVFAAGSAAFAATLDMRVLGLFCVGGLVLYPISLVVARRLRAG